MSQAPQKKTWAEINRKLRCNLCREEDSAFKMVTCVGGTCSKSFHRTCIDPLYMTKPTDTEFLCEACEDNCRICLFGNVGGSDDDSASETENPLIVCDECDACFHYECLDDDDRPPYEEIGDDDAPRWLCVECYDTAMDEAADECCVVCSAVLADDGDLVECAECFELAHVSCVPCKYIDDDGADEWLCAACNQSLNEWAEEKIVPDADMAADECFTESTCDCEVCSDMNSAVATWDEWEPTSIVQQGFKRALNERAPAFEQLMQDVHARHNKSPPPEK